MDRDREVDREVITVSPTPEGQEEEAEEVGWLLLLCTRHRFLPEHRPDSVHNPQEDTVDLPPLAPAESAGSQLPSRSSLVTGRRKSLAGGTGQRHAEGADST